MLLGEIKEITGKVRAEEQAKLQALQTQEANEANGRVWLMWVLVGSVSVVTIMIQLLLANSIVGPIQTLATAVRRMQKGDLSARAKLNSGDEIQSLGETFNDMAESIVQSQRETARKERTAFRAAGGLAPCKREPGTTSRPEDEGTGGQEPGR